MSAITTHVLDTSRGCPAPGVPVVLQQRNAQNEWRNVGHGETDRDGRLRTLMPSGTALEPGIFRLVFDTGRYFEALGTRAFYPHVIVVFEVASGDAHYHVPLLVSPFGYTTYRGS
jgi:5-hydroxyisourate hydrolase